MSHHPHSENPVSSTQGVTSLPWTNMLSSSCHDTISVCVRGRTRACMCACHSINLQRDVFKGQRTTYGSWSSPSTMWNQGLALSCQAPWQASSPIEPSHWLYIQCFGGFLLFSHYGWTLRYRELFLHHKIKPQGFPTKSNLCAMPGTSQNGGGLQPMG